MVRLLCAIDTIQNLFGTKIAMRDMNTAIEFITQQNKQEDKRRLAAKLGAKLPRYGAKNRGNLSEKVLIHLIQTHCGCDVLKLDLHTGRAGIGRVADFIAAYHSSRSHGGDCGGEERIYLVGWASNGHYDLDDGISHFTGIRDGLFYDGLRAPPAPVTADTIAAAYHGMDLTRLKAFVLRPKMPSKKRKRIVVDAADL